MDHEENTASDDHCSTYDSSSKGAPVKEITTDMMGILGQIKKFVSTLDENEDQNKPSPKNLRKALKLIGRAKRQLIGSEPVSPSEPSQNQELHEQLVEHMELLQAHIDENIRLTKVKDEVTEVMDMLASHLEKLGLKLTVTSADDTEESTATSDASAIDREEDETGTSLAEEEDMSVENEGVDAEEEEAGSVEDVEKSELEETKEEAKETAEEGWWTDDTDAGTTDDEKSSLASELGSLSDVSTVDIRQPANIILKRYLAESNVKPSYKKVELPEGTDFHVACYCYSCHVLSLMTLAKARSRRSAKVQAAQTMLALIATHQQMGSLPPELRPFTDGEMEELRPLFETSLENPVNRLKSRCVKLDQKAPNYSVLETSVNPAGKREVTVRCDALELTATGVGTNKRKARREAARNILLDHERETIRKRRVE